MTTARTIGLGCCLIILFSVGAAALSQAQQTTAKSAPQALTRNELRERVLKLRTEVDLLQLEFDGTRGFLVEVLGEAEKAKVSSLSPEEARPG